MATKSNIVRNEQAKKQAKLDLKAMVAGETKAIIRDMRRLGFAPPKGNITQKQFERYTAFVDAQSANLKASALAVDMAAYSANGGLLSTVLERLNRPGVKATEFATLSAVAARLVALGPTLAEKVKAESNLGGPSLPDDDRLDDIADDFGGEL